MLCDFALDHGQIVADEDVGQVKFFLQVQQQMEHRGLQLA